MAEERDIRVPLISCFLFFLVIIGGVFLVLYIYLPDNSQPWYLVAAFLLIGSPWVFWVLTFVYTFCIKRRSRQISAAAAAAASGESKNIEEPRMENNNNGDVSVATSKECEMPLTSSLPS